jgi:putative transposase
VQRPRKGIPDKHPDRHKIYAYLLEGVEVTRINQVWSTDITTSGLPKGSCIWWPAGMPSGPGTPDWFSRFVLSRALSPTVEWRFCVEAPKRAFGWGRPEIFNSDQGSQFTSERFTGELESRGVAVSMDGRGRYLENIFSERLWRSLKYEEVYWRGYALVPEARTGVGNWFRFYNHERPHQSLGYRTPAELYLAGGPGRRSGRRLACIGGAAPKPSGFIAFRPERLALQWRHLSGG